MYIFKEFTWNNLNYILLLCLNSNHHYIYFLFSFHLFQFLVQVLNTFSLWGPHEALKIILRNQKYLQYFKSARNISLVTPTASFNLHHNQKCKCAKTPHLPKQKCASAKISIFDTNVEISTSYISSLWVYWKTPSVKTRLLFDIFDLNSDRFLSQKEITTILESAINQTGIKVKRYWIAPSNFKSTMILHKS